MSEFVKIDFGALEDQEVPYERKKRMLDTIFYDIVPYRYEDGPRLFPAMGFYTTLLYNRNDLHDLWPFICRFHSWISFLLDDAADYALDILRKVAAALSARKFVDPVVLDMGRLSMEPPEIPELDTAVLRSIEAPHLDFGMPGPLDNDLALPAELQSTADLATALPDMVDPYIGSLDLPECEPLSAPGALADAQLPIDGLDDHIRMRTESTAQLHSQDPVLAMELNQYPTLAYHGIIQDMDHFKQVNDAYECHLKRSAGVSSVSDPSWPTTNEKQTFYVRELFESISDMSDFAELKTAREALARAGIELSPSSGTPAGDDIEIELLCWRLLSAGLRSAGNFRSPSLFYFT
ncbi:hypothetical protein Cob_v007210 [Colletotrichum orbiculare MAFF 240422]|uniref:Uncharacterized protein n=1 Tax=Colletotrichum orbiculare (strain 104-T / ATCC 96160 / CBS 514.97 / LARS 414 / MAFF 240422) TaxID=1213857 RepID=A0A484FQL9_COLOR|nr:hypothetical protein Cob_v007210 [Colletotrichum orbiculare MAFF 240422]